MLSLPKTIHIQRVNADFRVEIENSNCRIFPGYKEQVEKIWKEELKKRHVFNGEVLTLKELNPSQANGQFVHYDSYIAQLREPKLREAFNIIPLGVSALLQACDHVLVAKRADDVTQYPGYYELAPSGSLDREALKGEEIDYKEQILKEMEEETAISREFVATIEPFAVIHDEEGMVMDLCSHVKLLDLPYLELKPTAEYASFSWVPCSQIFDFVVDRQEDFVPTSLGIVKEVLKRAWI